MTVKSAEAIPWLFLGFWSFLGVKGQMESISPVWGLPASPLMFLSFPSSYVTIHLPVPQRHVSSGLENDSHRLCLTTALAGKPGHCLAIQPQAEEPALALPLVPHLKTAELTGLHRPIRRCMVPILLWLLLSAEMRTGWTKVTSLGIAAYYSKWMFS